MFDKVFVVNLDRRKDRWEEFQRVEWPFKYERFSACDGLIHDPPSWWDQGRGSWGCMLSHMTLLQMQVREGWDTMLVLEDDARPHPNFEEGVKRLLAGGKDWDMLYLGGQNRGVGELLPAPVRPGVLQYFKVNRTHGYAITRSAALKMFNFLWRTISDLPSRYHVDWRYEVMHPQMRVLGPEEWLLYQVAGHSDVTGREHSKDRDWQGDTKVKRDVRFSRLAKHPTLLLVGERARDDRVTSLFRRLGFRVLERFPVQSILEARDPEERAARLEAELHRAVRRVTGRGPTLLVCPQMHEHGAEFLKMVENSYLLDLKGEPEVHRDERAQVLDGLDEAIKLRYSSLSMEDLVKNPTDTLVRILTMTKSKVGRKHLLAAIKWIEEDWK